MQIKLAVRVVVLTTIFVSLALNLNAMVKDLPNEVWKNFPLNPYTKYQVSNCGRIKSVFNKLMASARMSKKGYPTTRLHYKGKEKFYFVHRMVAITHIENLHNYPQVNHKDCNKANNHVDNLEWCTNKMNKDHAVANGISGGAKGEDHPRARLTEKQILKIRDLFALGCSRRQLAEKYNTKPSNIKDIVLRRSWRHI